MSDDLFIFDEVEEDEEWFCSECNMGPMESTKTKCPRCGFKQNCHWEKETELDENGEPIDESYYEKYY